MRCLFSKFVFIFAAVTGYSVTGQKGMRCDAMPEISYSCKTSNGYQKSLEKQTSLQYSAPPFPIYALFAVLSFRGSPVARVHFTSTGRCAIYLTSKFGQKSMEEITADDSWDFNYGSFGEMRKWYGHGHEIGNREPHHRCITRNLVINSLEERSGGKSGFCLSTGVAFEGTTIPESVYDCDEK